MMRFFKSGPPPHQVALAMVGARPGDAVLFIGGDEATLAAAVAGVTGLNGQTTLACQGPQIAARVERAARTAGSLVDVVDAPATQLPFGAGRFAIVVVSGLAAMGERDRLTALKEAMRIMPVGGRLVIVSRSRPPGALGMLAGSAPTLAADAIMTLLSSAGAIATRLLADFSGVAYFEGRKPRAEGTLGT